MTDYRGALLDWAKSQVGPGDRVAYWLSALGYDPGKGKAWCGAFCLAGLHHVGLARDFKWGIDGSGMVGPLRLPRTTTPSRGDIGYLHSPFQHHFLFDYEHDGWVHSVDGNQPGVKEQRRRKDKLVFFSIEPLIRALDTEPAPAPTEPTMPAVPRRTLRWSMNGEDVRELQGLLNQFGHALVCDGNFGRMTESAVKSFQRRAGLAVDGVVGPKTWKAILQ